MKKKLLTLFLVILLSACSTKKPVPGIRKEVFLNNSSIEVKGNLNNITIPQDAATGTTKMRVVVMASQATAFQENILEYSCGPLDILNNFGEMEDYTVNIQATASVNDNELNKIKVFGQIMGVFMRKCVFKGVCGC